MEFIVSFVKISYHTYTWCIISADQSRIEVLGQSNQLLDNLLPSLPSSDRILPRAHLNASMAVCREQIAQCDNDIRVRCHESCSRPRN